MEISKNQISQAETLAKIVSSPATLPAPKVNILPLTSPALPVATQDPKLATSAFVETIPSATATAIANEISNQSQSQTMPLNDAELYNQSQKDQMETKETTYLELNFPTGGNPTPATGTGSTLTEDQKKQRAIIIASVVLGLMVLMIILFTRNSK